MNRREIIKTYGLIFAASSWLISFITSLKVISHENWIRPKNGKWTYFLNPKKFEVVASISGLIIPKCDKYGGAIQAKVPEFIDNLLKEGTSQIQKNFEKGLEDLDRLSKKKFSRNFCDIDNSEKILLLKIISKNELSPKRPAESLFVSIKQMSLLGFQLSEVGYQFRNKPTRAYQNYPGCRNADKAVS